MRAGLEWQGVQSKKTNRGVPWQSGVGEPRGAAVLRGWGRQACGLLSQAGTDPVGSREEKSRCPQWGGPSEQLVIWGAL